jgi:hypothetical protein
MSTNYEDLEHLGILITEFAGPADEGADRFRLQFNLTRPYSVLTRDAAIEVGKLLIALANNAMQCTLPTGHSGECLHDPAADAGDECNKVIIPRVSVRSMKRSAVTGRLEEE